jgi:Flp pilus assembly protein TadG
MPFRTARLRRGVAAVEFAVVAPVLLLLIFGIIELGRALMVQHVLSEAARDSARYAVVTEGANKSTPVIQAYALSRLKSYGITTANIPVVLVNDSSSTDLSACTGPTQQTGAASFGKYTNGSEVTVKVTVNFSEVTWIPFVRFIGANAQLTAQYTLRRDPL